MHLLDELYPHAVAAVTNERKASTSYIQRKLQIGYNTAAALMERMEAEGVVSASDHVGRRNILIGPTEAPESVAPEHVPEAGKMVGDGAPQEVSPAAAAVPEPEPEAPYTGPTKRFTCDGCDTDATGPVNGLPRGWWTQTSGTLGTLYKCQTCAERNASRIATEHMTTEQILNAGSDGAQVDVITSAAQGRLKSFVERIERLIEDAQAIAGDIKDVKAEAKGEGFDITVLMMVIRDRAKDKQKLAEQQQLYDLYLSAIGGL